MAILLSGPGVQRWLNIAPGSLLALYPPLSREERERRQRLKEEEEMEEDQYSVMMMVRR